MKSYRETSTYKDAVEAFCRRVEKMTGRRPDVRVENGKTCFLITAEDIERLYVDFYWKLNLFRMLFWLALSGIAAGYLVGAWT